MSTDKEVTRDDEVKKMRENLDSPVKCTKKCNGCPYLLMAPDPDPDDWFRDDDEMAFCTKCNKVIEHGLVYWELENVVRPKWCPKNQNETH